MTIKEESGILSLDLHGYKHEEISRLIENFVFLNQSNLPLKIICGNSQKMIDLSIKILEEHSIKYSFPRFGIIRIDGI